MALNWLLSCWAGQIYSVNDARYFDWPEGLRQYIDTIRQGKGRYPKKYSARYICSLVADLHRTLMYGGVAMNPRNHLRLVYEANPLSFIVEQAGGRGSDGKSRILSLQPVKLHQRLPLFLGSLEDMEELESYGDVQQKVNPGYEVWCYSMEVLNLQQPSWCLTNLFQCSDSSLLYVLSYPIIHHLCWYIFLLFLFPFLVFIPMRM